MIKNLSKVYTCWDCVWEPGSVILLSHMALFFIPFSPVVLSHFTCSMCALLVLTAQYTTLCSLVFQLSSPAGPHLSTISSLPSSAVISSLHAQMVTLFQFQTNEVRYITYVNLAFFLRLSVYMSHTNMFNLFILCYLWFKNKLCRMHFLYCRRLKWGFGVGVLALLE